MKLGCKIIALSMLATASTSCAATPDTMSKRESAVLLNADRADIREAIRVFVRGDAGRFVRAEPNSLTLSPNMKVNRRARDFEYGSRTLPAADLDYHLVSDGGRCWLIRHETDRNSPIAKELLLPASAQCALYRP